ncbi:serine hydrolase [Ruminococcus sp.]|uniref:serine hydrolase domain-containing protein n=1 Tax=Ruminococcus sp. TaxID=41978 RepID=UPI0025EDB958|nr:serine hydrolase [Ruminococcus sp.]MBQ8965297.1 serine hydrolase [Ruminococcus sp.]
MTKIELHKYVEESTGNESNICQISAVKNGGIVYSDSWRGFTQSSAANVNSVTKGIMALLTGIALDKGFIKSTGQKVMEFFPNYTVKRGEKTIYDVTVEHLLTMTAPYKYRSEPWTKVCTSPDWTKAALDLLGGKKGITGEFKYATLGIQILAGIIENASGMKCIDFANEFLFGPLDIPKHKIHGESSKEDQFNFIMNKLPMDNEWYSDPQDTVTAGWGLTLSANDMAKIGYMLINKGIYGGRQVLSEEWIKQMTAPKVQLDKKFGNMQYCYLWYLPRKNSKAFAAIGDFGNIIYADPEKDIAVGITGTFKPRIFDRVDFIEKNVIPLVESLWYK